MSHWCEETYDVYTERVVKCRKARACDACERPIRRGDRYARVFVVFDGRTETITRCLACQVTHEHLRQLCFSRGDMWPDERLRCGLVYRDEWKQDPPPEIAALPLLSPDEVQALAPKANGGFRA